METISFNLHPHPTVYPKVLFLTNANDMPQAVKCHLFPYVNRSCIACQHKDINEIEIKLNEYFSNICDWFVDNKYTLW